MTEEKLCHLTLSIDEDDNGNLINEGAPCIKGKCMAWEPDDTRVAGGRCVARGTYL